MDNNDIYKGIIFENNLKVSEIKYLTMIIKNVLNEKEYDRNNKLYKIVYKNIKEKNK